MYQYLALTVLCGLIARSAIVAALTSPCPKIFTYEGEPETDRWYGVMTFSSNVELVGLTYKIQLDRPGQLLVSWDGEVRSEDNINFSVFDPNHFQRAREVVKTRIMVKFDSSYSPPSVVKIIINGNTVCSGDGNSPLTLGATTETSGGGRPDPFSVDEEVVVPEYNNRPNSNQNTNSGYDKNRPSYYETPTYNGGNSGQSYNPNVDNGQSYSQNTGYQQSNNNPSQSTNSNNNKNSNSNPSYSGSQNYMPDIVYPANHQPSSSSFSGSQSQWSGETQQSGYNGNRLNGSGPVVNTGPVVTTLTLPNVTQNKNNVDTIIQLIKTQLEQQPSSSNNTVIVALVSPGGQVNTNSAAHQGAASSGSQSRDSLVETTHRTTIPSTQSSVVASKVRSTPTSPTVVTKTPSNNRNKD